MGFGHWYRQSPLDSGMLGLCWYRHSEISGVNGSVPIPVGTFCMAAIECLMEGAGICFYSCCFCGLRATH